MSDPRFPPELFDYLTDLLHDQPNTLKQCSLVSKSWVPRTRKHLFSGIAFQSRNDLDVCKELFPADPNALSVCYTHSLSLRSMDTINALIREEEGYWLIAFSNFVRLTLRHGMGNLYLLPSRYAFSLTFEFLL